ncbi:MAG: hypothetical protein ACFHWX_06385 [Bacteroidota bacterium]
MKNLILLMIVAIYGCNQTKQQPTAPIPVIDGDFWRIVEAPDLDSLNGPDPEKQHVVDHGFIKDNDGKWHLWACIRGTKVSRLLYGWEGESLTGGKLWDQVGVVARALPEWNEQVSNGNEQIQAPYFRKVGDEYFCFYNSSGIRAMISEDGSDYTRLPIKNGSNLLYEKGGRDVMIIDEKDTYFSYSTISTVAKDGWTRGFVSLRTSKDLVEWSDYTIVSEGGRAGNGPVSAESPFVQKYNGYYFLFRTSSATGSCFVYRSKDPYNFGVNNDEKLIAEFPVKAPEIIQDGDEWFISDIADFQGVKLARLKWKEETIN